MHKFSVKGRKNASPLAFEIELASRLWSGMQRGGMVRSLESAGYYSPRHGKNFKFDGRNFVLLSKIYER